MQGQTLNSVLRSSSNSEKALLRDTCRWYMRQYDAANKHAEQQNRMQREWKSRCDHLQSEYDALKCKYEALEKEVDKLLVVIASLKKPPKRKPIPKMVHICHHWQVFDWIVGMYRLS
jgi:predicted RNase H-like nuclease (RuvC/YqgF family)